jgi:hypothetical protein
MGTGVLSQGEKEMVGVNIDITSKSSTEVKNKWSHTSIPLYAFMALTGETLPSGTIFREW